MKILAAILLYLAFAYGVGWWLSKISERYK
jgi:hypothetical protein